MLKKNVLIVGLGSAGARHVKNLKSLGIKNIYTTINKKRKRRFNLKKIIYLKNIDYIINNHKIDFAIISNPTSEHLKFSIKLAKKNIDLFIEKPISNNLRLIHNFKKIVKKNKIKVAIGCQLRFHPALVKIKEIINKKLLGKPLSVYADVGEYLPNWHPYEDYRKSYVAKQKLGGGVILTLIHEIDYLYWLFGKFKSVFAIGGQHTSLKIDTEDNICCLLKGNNDLPILLRMDLWRRNKTRCLNIVLEHGQIDLNLINGELNILNFIKKTKVKTKFLVSNLQKENMKHFLNSINFRQTKEVTSLQDAEYVLKIALNLKDSLKQKHSIKV